MAGIITPVSEIDTADVKGALGGAAKVTTQVEGDGVKALKEGPLEAAQGAKSGA